MPNYVIRDPDAARQHLLQGLLLSRCAPLTPARTHSALQWAMEIVSDGSPLPPLGYVADVGYIAFGLLRSDDMPAARSVPGLDPTVTRRYEDYVLGKLYSDISFERGGDALMRYSGRDQHRGLAYMINQQRARCGFEGVELTPAVIKGLLQVQPEAVVALAWQSVEQDGVSEFLLEEYEALIAAIRNTGDLLGPEDIFELESGTALAEFGQRIALRQVLQAAALLQRDLPTQKPRSQTRCYSVATNIREEDNYPIGGFTSISNRGTIESLVRSELAYMDDEVRPDLFDIKYARNELLYYSRDENQFLRRRLSFVFVLHADLVTARIKDNELPYQRIILLLASLYVSVRQLLDWLSHDAIRFEFLFVTSGDPSELTDERILIETLLREEQQLGNVFVESVSAADIASHCIDLARTSLCHTLAISTGEVPYTDDVALASRMQIDAAQPTLIFPDDVRQVPEEFALAGWCEQLDRLLKFWV
jgi:vWA domain found in the FtsH ternary systems/N-terminal helical region fused to the FtsH ternary system vWA domain